jgi:hypothetical protein
MLIESWRLTGSGQVRMATWRMDYTVHLLIGVMRGENAKTAHRYWPVNAPI